MKNIISTRTMSGLCTWQQHREGTQSVPARVLLGPLPTVQGRMNQMTTTQLCRIHGGRNSEVARSLLREPF